MKYNAELGRLERRLLRQIEGNCEDLHSIDIADYFSFSNRCVKPVAKFLIKMYI